MIALAIAGGLLVTLIYTMNYHLGIAEKQEFQTVASMLARDKLYETVKKPANASGNFPEPYSVFRYRSDLKESPINGMMEITVVVSRGKEEVKFSELVQKPK